MGAALHLQGHELVRIPTLGSRVHACVLETQQGSSGYQNGYNQLSSERKCLHASLAALTPHQKAPRGLLLRRWPCPCGTRHRICLVLFVISPVIRASTHPPGIFFFFLFLCYELTVWILEVVILIEQPSNRELSASPDSVESDCSEMRKISKRRS